MSHALKGAKSAFLAGLLAVLANPAAGQKPNASCTTQITPLTRELRQGIPLPRSFSNPTSERVTFIMTMRTNALFGPAHELSRVSLDAKTGQQSSEPFVHPTGLRTPVGTARVIIDVTTDRTGSQVVGQCDYQLTMKPPPGVTGKVPTLIASQRSLSYLQQLPVRMCVLEGSTLAGGKAAGDTIGGRDIRDLLEAVNTDVWFPNAQIAFSSAIETGFPVVADPSPPPGPCGVKGDLNSAGPGGGDGLFAETACATAWSEKYPGRAGIPIIFARDFCASGSAKGAAPGPDEKLYVKSMKARTGERGDDLCGFPQHLTAADIVNPNRRPFVILVEPTRNSNARNALAHELGHNLFLGHGNGLDDNHDGVAAGRRGPKRYDEYCDPAWLIPPGLTELAEDKDAPFVSCEQSGSLMQGSAGCANLQPLQVETARGLTHLMPGFIDTTPRPVVSSGTH